MRAPPFAASLRHTVVFSRFRILTTSEKDTKPTRHPRLFGGAFETGRFMTTVQEKTRPRAVHVGGFEHLAVLHQQSQLKNLLTQFSPPVLAVTPLGPHGGLFPRLNLNFTVPFGFAGLFLTFSPESSVPVYS